jgi:hypothetical protein
MGASFAINSLNTAEGERQKNTITPFERLKKRILKEFTKKLLIGDILINEQEYDLLIDYFKAKCHSIRRTNNRQVNDPIFATALVQIGIRFYDGNLWGHIASVLGVDRINPNHQTSIGDSFVHTLKSNSKLMLDKSEKASNILMHGFVSDYYANEMFDFLFKYYTIDLERDLVRNTPEMMNDLMEIAKRNDNTGRTYLLVKQTANALGINAKGGKIRLRRMLRLIDKCFWEQIKPTNPLSRLSVLFNNWTESSAEFQHQYQKFHSIAKNGGGKKSYSSPYLKVNFKQTKFKLVLPAQLIKFDFERDVHWSIKIENTETTASTSLYQAVTGYKTEEKEISIREEDLFKGIQIELISDGERVRLFKIKSDCIRFFDMHGDFLHSDNSLPKGEVYAFTFKNETPRSEALIENTPVRNLVRSFFEFEHGDIVRLPDGNPISIGKKIEEGLQERKMVRGVQVNLGNAAIPVYASPPTILLKIAPKRAVGTMIEINDLRYRLFEHEATVIELEDRSGDTGYILNLNNYSCKQSGIYRVHIDVPNDRTNRDWTFALIDQMNFEFEDAPYIFQSRGTIRFAENLKLYPRGADTQKNSDQNSYNFAIDPYLDQLQFVYPTSREEIQLNFNIPAFKWKFDKGPWHVEKPSDIWHSDVPTMIYMKYPADKIKLSMDENIQEDHRFDEQMVNIHQSKSKGIFECDMTRFKSWLGRDKVLRIGYLEFPHNRTEFMRIITRSVMVSMLLKGDFESDILRGELDIVGRSNYFVDVNLLDSNERLTEKLPVVDGKFELSGPIGSGIYKVTLFEDEDDDTGFGAANYLPLGTYEQKLTNPLDLQGKNIVIRSIKKGYDSIFQMGLSCTYIVSHLRKISLDDRHSYKGKLVAQSHNRLQNPITYDVKVWFPDLNKLQFACITYFDGYDDVEFLYDTHRRFIVKVEEKGLSRAVRYRRYECLFADDYVYQVAFND